MSETKKTESTEPKRISVKLILKEEMLGTASSNPDIHSEYIASKAPNYRQTEEETEAVDIGEVEKGKTIFPRDDDGNPIIWDYQIKGFFKDACGMLRKLPGYESTALKTYKKMIDGLIFVEPRKIKIELPDGGEIGDCQRPLRAQTMQGERVALANSETVPEESVICFDVVCYDKSHTDAVCEWLNYGCMRGLGQWRNSGKGKFRCIVTDPESGEVIFSNIR